MSQYNAVVLDHDTGDLWVSRRGKRRLASKNVRRIEFRTNGKGKVEATKSHTAIKSPGELDVNIEERTNDYGSYKVALIE